MRTLTAWPGRGRKEQPMSNNNISPEDIHKLNCLPLDEVMANHGHMPVRQTRTAKWYVCPFHHESDASFRVDLEPGAHATYAGTFCHGGCPKNGPSSNHGAVFLEMHLLEIEGKPYSQWDACRKLAEDFNVEIGGQNYNSYWRRQNRDENIPLKDEIEFNVADRAFTDEELNALGCKVSLVTRRERDADGISHYTEYDEEGNVMKRYSFDPAFYTSPSQPSQWDSRVLTKMFNLYPLRQDWEGGLDSPAHAYISRKEQVGDTDEWRSYKIYAKRSYPIFAFIYKDRKGWWARRYEPYFREDKTGNGRKSPNYKFTWWYEGNRQRRGMDKMIYGDNDVMRALDNYGSNADVEQTDDTRAWLREKTYPVVMGDNEMEAKRKVFDKIIICSGPRDGLSTYFHSDAHVVWPHSEKSVIPKATMQKLFDICDKLYVMYDADKTGILNMNELAFDNIDLKLIYLPDDIRRYMDKRTGKPSKDAEQFFNNYPAGEGYKHINARFASMVTTAPTMKFWMEHGGQRKNKDGNKEWIDKFDINITNLKCFLNAMGVFTYVDETGASRFVRVVDNKVDIIKDDEMMTHAENLMLSFITEHDEYYNESLANAISTQKKVSMKSLKTLRPVRLNFESWGSDYDWFFFPNRAVKVTSESIMEYDYSEMDCHVNSRAILRNGPEQKSASREQVAEGLPFRLHEPYFRIYERAEYKAAKQRYEQQMKDDNIPFKEKDQIEKDFISYQKLWRWKLEFTRDLKDMPPVVQFVYDTCRIHWEKEQQGYELEAKEKQEQDMHFVNKAASLGYLLSRYRTATMQMMTVFTDHCVPNSGKSNGGTGKSTYGDLLETVRKVCRVSGGSYEKKGEKVASNFQEFTDTEHQLVFIDDLERDIQGEEFKNLTTDMTVKTLYQNKYTVPRERVPKFFITTNQELDVDNPSVYRRCYSSYTSNFYHPANFEGSRRAYTPKDRFGKDFVLQATEMEYNAIRNLMLQFCQFYLQHQEVILTPHTKEDNNRYLMNTIKDKAFILWANDFFSKDWHFGRPVSLRDMALSYLDSRKDCNPTNKLIENTGTSMRPWIEDYCRKYGFVFNPPVVYNDKRKPKDWEQRSEKQKQQFRSTFGADKGNGVTRVKAWVPAMEGETPTDDRRRELSASPVPCYYFFRHPSHIPLNVWDLGKPLMEWEAPDEWELEQGCEPCKSSE